MIKVFTFPCSGFLVLVVSIVILSGHLFAQTPTTQDCLGAIPVCDYIYQEDSTAAGHGAYFEIPNGGNGCPNGHCMDGEKNSRWYIWTVVTSGDLRLNITPQTQTDDYDWAVFNLTQYKCQDIYAHPDWVMSSCNAAGGPGYQGMTGISSANGGNTNCNNGGGTNKWNVDLPVYEGETYVLVVSDWTQTPGGYTLDFSPSTAVIFDDQKPFISYIGGEDITECGTTELTISFNENVKCSSLSPGDLTLDGPGGPYEIDSIYGENCELGGDYERDFILYFSPGIARGGDYTLEIENLSFISDACNNYAAAEVFDFEVELDAPIADAGEDVDIAYGASTTLEGDAEGGSGNFFYHWEPADLLVNPDVKDPTTVDLTASTEFTLSVYDVESSCEGEDNVWVNVVGGPLGVTVGASSTEICTGEIVNLYAYPDGGSGDYTYSWTSDPAGFTSNQQNPSDFPSGTTTYILEISDGFTVVEDEITITVNPTPTANAGIDQTINEGTTTFLEGSGEGGSGNLAYLWEPASYLVQHNVSNPQTVVLYDPIVFTLLVEDEKGCVSDPDNVLINTEGPALSAVPFSETPEICSGAAVTIHANATGGGGEYTYSWTSDPPGFTSNQSTFTDYPNQDTRYDLLLTDQFDNQITAHINIKVNPLPVIDLVPDGIPSFGEDSIIVCVRDSVLLDAGFDEDPSGTIYFWNNNFEGRYLRATTNGNWIDLQTHVVEVQHGITGCRNSGELTIVFDYNQCEIFVPEINTNFKAEVEIHPNPNNGVFLLTLKEDLEDINIAVFDISGRLVYSTSWEGKHHAEAQKRIGSNGLDEGVYFVHISSGNKSANKRMIIRK
jgi:hypothetical protein